MITKLLIVSILVLMIVPVINAAMDTTCNTHSVLASCSSDKASLDTLKANCEAKQKTCTLSAASGGQYCLNCLRSTEDCVIALSGMAGYVQQSSSSVCFNGVYETVSVKINDAKTGDSCIETPDTSKNFMCPSNPTCTDSDNGVSYGVSGYTTVGTSKYYDYCESANSIYEYSCSGNSNIGQSHPCSCVTDTANGAYCQSMIVCNEEDNGLNYMVKSEIMIDFTVRGTDYCSGNVLTEFYCNLQNTVTGYNTEVVNCQTIGSNMICSNGACVQNSGCIPDWYCYSWGTCTGGKQSRTCVDRHTCYDYSSSPPLTRACTMSCTNTWDADPCGSYTADEFSSFSGKWLNGNTNLQEFVAIANKYYMG